MDLRAQLQQHLDAASGTAFLDAALAAVRATDRSDELQAAASWALATAVARPAEDCYGPLQMVAGAASGRAALLTAAVPAPAEETTLLAALGALQDRLDQGLEPGRGLADFAALGAQLLANPVARYLDMRLRTDPDDTVFFWASGALALKQGATGSGL